MSDKPNVMLDPVGYMAWAGEDWARRVKYREASWWKRVWYWLTW